MSVFILSLIDTTGIPKISKNLGVFSTRTNALKYVWKQRRIGTYYAKYGTIADVDEMGYNEQRIDYNPRTVVLLKDTFHELVVEAHSLE